MFNMSMYMLYSVYRAIVNAISAPPDTAAGVGTDGPGMQGIPAIARMWRAINVLSLSCCRISVMLFYLIYFWND